MLEQVGRFVGSLAADVVNAFRGRQAVPCLVEWEQPPGGWFAFGSHVNFAGPLEFSAELTNDGLPKWERPLPIVSDDDCGDCAGNCCLTTDTLNEWGK